MKCFRLSLQGRDEFREQFGLGRDAERISLTDLGGVSLAAIQALEQQNSVLIADNAALQQRMEALEQRVATLAAQR